MRYLLVLLIIVPAAEISLLLLSGKTIGVLPTLLLIILTGVLGTFLAKREGLYAMQEVQKQLQKGQLPGREIIDGICILIGGILLVTPGFITDIGGFLLVFPPTRRLFRSIILHYLKRKIEKGNIKIIK